MAKTTTPPQELESSKRNWPIWTADKVEQTAIFDLNLYDNQVRTHSDKHISQLAEAIATFGFVVPVIIESKNNVVTGHGRIEAAKRLGLTTIPTICADHLTPAQVKAYRIADNKLGELSDWNEEALRIEFGDLMELSLAGELDFSLDITGFEMPEIDIFIVGTSDAAVEPAETVEMPDPAKTCVTQPGDLWVLEEHRLLCGDSLNTESYERVLDGDECRMVFTDPPYNVPVNGHIRSGNSDHHREFAMASGEMTEAEFLAFLTTFITLICAHLKAGAIVMICMDWRHIDQLIIAGKRCGLEFINLCVWNKTNGGMGSLYRSKHELVAIFKKPGAAHINNVALGKHGRNRTNVWDYAGVNTFGAGREADLVDHPTVKPTALVADAIMDVSHRGDIVLDAFGGSGATLLAAEKTGRRARLIELDPLYVDVAIRRWQEMTGKQAIHATTSETWEHRAAAVAAAKEVTYDQA